MEEEKYINPILGNRINSNWVLKMSNARKAFLTCGHLPRKQKKEIRKKALSDYLKYHQMHEYSIKLSKL